jgi:hypothetical protein
MFIIQLVADSCIYDWYYYLAEFILYIEIFAFILYIEIFAIVQSIIYLEINESQFFTLYRRSINHTNI